jgi:formylglycine-generating enzyme required for sulfatase activity
MVMVYIPEGGFEMGSIDGYADEQPVHTVSLDAYWMDQTEVTNAMYKQCMEDGVCEIPAYWDNYNDASYLNHPIFYVDWYRAEAYCQWAGRRLPTEAEWEIAARGGLEGKDYPWGDEDPVCEAGATNGAQYLECEPDPALIFPVPVMSFSPNGFGLFDMAGNVLEWVMDWYQSDYYTFSPSSNPQGPDADPGQGRVLRGGGIFDYDLNVAYRLNNIPGVRSKSIGFRCVVGAAP